MRGAKHLLPILLVVICALVLLCPCLAQPTPNGETGLAAIEQQMYQRLPEDTQQVARTFGQPVDPANVTIFDAGTGWQYSLAQGLSRPPLLTRKWPPEAHSYVGPCGTRGGPALTSETHTYCCYPGMSMLYNPVRHVISKPGFAQIQTTITMPKRCSVDYVPYNAEKQEYDRWNECLDVILALHVPDERMPLC